jgi:two-component system cell cycle response regulator
VANADGKKTTVESTLSTDALRVLHSVASTEACVVVLAGGRLGQHVTLTDQALEIGRSGRCGLQLDVPSVSRIHGHIEWDGYSHVLVDGGSTNGTYVGERRIARHALRDGDRFQMGHVLIKYLASGNIEAAYHAEIQRLARQDPLTGIANKACFDEALQQAVTPGRSGSEPLTLLVWDLDHFKRINDTYGHPAGDSVLRQAASLAQAQLESDQLVGRVGGEEFAVLCPRLELAGGRGLGERIRAGVERFTFVFDDQQIAVTTSVGVASCLPDSDESAAQLFARADARLYEAKAAGRNCVRA